jgi:hypothetical protein
LRAERGSLRVLALISARPVSVLAKRWVIAKLRALRDLPL